MPQRSIRSVAIAGALLAGAACASKQDASDTAAAATDSAATATATATASTVASTDSAGWRFLFDGQSLAGWRGYKGAAIGAGWHAMNGELMHTKDGGDIVTDGQFGDFELELEWKVQPGGNSGIFYRATETAERIYETAPEYQVLDDARHADGKDPLRSAGSAYGLYAPPRGVVKPAGEWNAARIVVRGNHVEHWLNGQKVVEYELGSPDWSAKVQASKFKDWPGYGKSARGHIGLQDHGDTVSFRNIRIRELK